MVPEALQSLDNSAPPSLLRAPITVFSGAMASTGKKAVSQTKCPEATLILSLASLFVLSMSQDLTEAAFSGSARSIVVRVLAPSYTRSAKKRTGPRHGSGSRGG